MQFIGNKINQRRQEVGTRGHSLGCMDKMAFRSQEVRVLPMDPFTLILEVEY